MFPRLTNLDFLGSTVQPSTNSWLYRGRISPIATVFSKFASNVSTKKLSPRVDIPCTWVYGPWFDCFPIIVMWIYWKCNRLRTLPVPSKATGLPKARWGRSARECIDTPFNVQQGFLANEVTLPQETCNKIMESAEVEVSEVQRNLRLLWRSPNKRCRKCLRSLKFISIQRVI